MSVRTIDWRRRTQAMTLAVLTVLIATPLAYGAHILLPHANLSLVFLSAVLITSGRAGMEAAIYASLLSFLSYNFFFTQPYYSLDVRDDGEVATLLFFLLMATLTGKLAARIRGEMARNSQMVQRLTNINQFTRLMATAPDGETVQRELAQHIATTFERPAWVILYQEGTACAAPGHPPTPLITPPDESLLMQLRGATTDGPFGQWYRLTLQLPHGDNGLVLLLGPEMGNADRELARILSDLAAATLGRALLVADLEQARFVSETEQLRSALLSSVSHDLRTPLASIIGSTSSLIEYPETINEVGRRELLQTVLEEAQRLNRYIQNLLDMTRLGGGKLTPSRDWVDLNDIISSAIERLHKELAPLQVELQLPAQNPLLYVHGVLIEQALVNVLDNAARFSPPQGRITISARHSEQTVTISVCDEGPGIPPEQREQVFDMFYTVRGGDRNRQGTGLGLAICRGMLNAHGGEVQASAGEAGVGTCIRLTLPLHHSES